MGHYRKARGGGASPVFVWRYIDRSGEEVGTSEDFADAEAAETWMGEAWPDLRDRGVEEVELIDQDRAESLYRMGLSEAGG